MPWKYRIKWCNVRSICLKYQNDHDLEDQYENKNGLPQKIIDEINNLLAQLLQGYVYWMSQDNGWIVNRQIGNFLLDLLANSWLTNFDEVDREFVQLKKRERPPKS